MADTEARPELGELELVQREIEHWRREPARSTTSSPCSATIRSPPSTPRHCYPGTTPGLPPRAQPRLEPAPDRQARSPEGHAFLECGLCRHLFLDLVCGTRQHRVYTQLATGGFALRECKVTTPCESSPLAGNAQCFVPSGDPKAQDPSKVEAA